MQKLILRLFLLSALVLPVETALAQQAPESVQRVRRHVAAIGSDEPVRPVIYPIVILTAAGERPPERVIIRETGEPVDTSAASYQTLPRQGEDRSDDVLRRLEDRLETLNSRLAELETALNSRTEQERYVRDTMTQETPPPDETPEVAYDPAPQDSLDVVMRDAPGDMPGVAPDRIPEDSTAHGIEPTRRLPTVVVEHALLEKGLFRATDVIFQFDEHTLLPAAENTLDAIGEVLEEHRDLQLEVAGHTDSIGPASYNQRLSQERAEAVRDYLVEHHGIDPERLSARGFGEAHPVASNDEETGRALNRRVEFIVIEPSGTSLD